MINSKIWPVKTCSQISKLQDNSKFKTLRFLRVSALSTSCGGSAVEVTVRVDIIINELEVKRDLLQEAHYSSSFYQRVRPSLVD